MDDITCGICFTVFNDRDSIPKSLDCGHTLCSSCVDNLLRSSPRCPQCRKQLSKPNIILYPTNYSLLNLCTTFSKLSIVKDQLKTDAFNLKSKFDSRLKGLIKEMKFLEDGSKQLEELVKSDTQKLDIERSVNLLSKLKKELHKMGVPEKVSLDDMIAFNLKDYESQEAYLYEVYNRIQQGGRLFTAEYLKNEFIFGRISVAGNKIFFHALCLSRTEEDAKLISFTDIKKCLHNEDIITFLEISCNNKGLQQIIEIKVTESHLSPQFVKLCTGECGPLYRNTSYKKGTENDMFRGILLVSEYREKDKQTSGQLDYIVYTTAIDVGCSRGDIIVTGFENGGFMIIDIKQDASYNNVIGQVIPPGDFKNLISSEDSQHLKIVDSGVVVKINE